jgi:DNA repair exonuclease SbcCD ATPase subunit
MNKTLKIIQISDIHIRERRRAEYNEVFAKLYKSISEQTANIEYNQRLIVICGNLFHNKTKLSPENIIDGSAFLRNLSNISPVIIIPGPHDIYDRSSGHIDLIDPIINECKDIHNIWYNPISGKYPHNSDILFIHKSFTSIQFPNINCDPEKINVLLIHEKIEPPVMSQLTNFDLVLGGSIPAKQILNIPNSKTFIGYSGSLIQQDISEMPQEHGYIIWSLYNDNQEFEITSKMVNIQNDYGFVKLSIKDDNIDMSSIPKHPYKVVINQKDCTEEFLMNLKKTIPNVIIHEDQLDETSTMLTSNEQTMHKKFEQLLNTHLTEKGVDDKLIAKISSLHKEKYAERTTELTSSQIRRWTLIDMKFTNLFCYRGFNYINFYNLHGISGIIADNRYGKSSIIDILIFVLFNHLNRGKLKDIINVHESSFKVEVTFLCDNQYYIITRAGFKSKEIVKLIRYDGQTNEYLDHSKGTIPDTYKEITDLIGDYDNFLTTIVITQDNVSNIIQMKNSERKLLLSKSLKLDTYSDIYEEMRIKTLTLKRAIDTIQKQIVRFRDYDELLIETNDLKRQLYDQSQECDQINTQLKEIYEKMNEYRSKITHISPSTMAQYKDPHILEDNISKLKLQLEQIKSIVPLQLYENLDIEIQSKRESCTQLNSDIEKFNSEISDYKSQLVMIPESYQKDLDLVERELDASKIEIAKYGEFNASTIPELEQYIRKLYESKPTEITVDDTQYDKIKSTRSKNIPYIHEQCTAFYYNNVTVPLTKMEQSIRDQMSNIKELKQTLANFEKDKQQLVIDQTQIIIPSGSIDKCTKQMKEYDQIISKLKINYDELVEAIAKCTTIERTMMNTRHSKMVLLSMTRIKYNTQCSMCTENKHMIYSYKLFVPSDKLPTLRSEVEILNKDIEKMSIQIKTFESGKDEIRSRIQKYDKLKIDLKYQYDELIQKTEILNQITMKITKIDSMIKTKQSLYSDTERVINEIITKYNSFNKIQYDPIKHIMDIKHDSDVFCDKIESLIPSIRKFIGLDGILRNLISQYDHDTSKLDKFEHDKSLIDERKQEISLITKQIEDKIQELDQLKLMKQCHDRHTLLSDKFKQCEQFIEHDIKNKELTKMIELKIPLLEAKQTQYKQFESNLSMFENIISIKNELKKSEEHLQIMESNNEYQIMLNELDIEVKTLNTKFNEISKIVIANTQTKTIIDEQLKMLEPLIDQQSKQFEDYRIFNEYLKCLDPRKGIPYKLLANSIMIIQNQVNYLLKEYTTFTIEISTNSANLDITIKEYGNILPLLSGSGYQKFIISLSFRIVLSNMIGKSIGDFMIIDEGFSCLDQDNIIMIEQFLCEVSKKFKFMLIISHIEDLQHCIKQALLITKSSDNSSHINIGDVDEKYLMSPETEIMMQSKQYCEYCQRNIPSVQWSKHTTSKGHNEQVKSFKLKSALMKLVEIE